jgi:fructose-1,6-bisphosphatase/inositol monophosphatase family enzyme
MTAGVNIDRVTALIAEIAAEEIMPRFTKLAAGDVREKGPGDLVTIADEETERRLTPLLTQLLPGSCVLGEEGAAASPALLDRLAGDAPVWVIDPVDGTSNFAAGAGDFGVMVALVRHDAVLAGWIHDPRTGETVTAEQGGGAWLSGRRLHVAKPPSNAAELSGVLLAGFFGNRDLGKQVQSRRERLNTLKSRRCAASEYRRLAQGEMHFALFTKLMPWDHCPGVLIHAEAGGYNSYVEGGRYTPSQIKASGLLLAPDKASWQQLYDILIAPEPVAAGRG